MKTKVLLVVYDNMSHVAWFPQGLASVAAVLRQENCSVEIYNQDIHHYSDEYLTEYLDNNKFDVIGISVVGGYWQYKKLWGIESTLKENIKIGFNIIWGNIGETKETLESGVNFLLKYDSCSELRTIRPVTPYPGCPLYYHAIENGLLDKDNPAQDFYENKHVNSDLLAVNFTNLSDEEFHKSLYEANIKLIENYFIKQKNSYINQAKKLYLNSNKKFRGFRLV